MDHTSLWWLLFSSTSGANKRAQEGMRLERIQTFWRPPSRKFSSTPNKNFYYILGLTPKATNKEIKDQFRKLALKWHPDRHHSVTEKQKAELEFRVITEAYDTLSDETKKLKYDAQQGFSFPGFSQCSPRGCHEGPMKCSPIFSTRASEGKEERKSQYRALSREETNELLQRFFNSGEAKRPLQKKTSSPPSAQAQFVKFNFGDIKGPFINPADLFEKKKFS